VPAPDVSPVERNDVRVVMLGTGTPNPEPERSGPAVAIVAGGGAFLVDAGAGVVRRAAAAAQGGIWELEPERLGVVFLTHLHSDHTLGLPDLALTPWVVGRRGPLHVYGPPGTAAMGEGILAAWKADIDVRTSGLEPGTGSADILVTHEVEPGVVYESPALRVTAFAVRHGEWEHAYGYRFDADGRSIVVSGDTTPDDAVVAACSGCDVLVHEVYSAARFAGRSADWQAYHRASHTSTVELAGIARLARPKLLVLYHLLPWGATDEELAREIGDAGYGGLVVVPRDLDVF